MGAAHTRRTIPGLVEAYYGSLYRFAFRLSGSGDEASDLVQETFLKAQSQLEKLRDQTRAQSWLFSILRNEYLHRQRQGSHRRQIALENPDELSAPMPPSEPTIEPEQLQAALNELPEEFRTPLILFYFEEFSYRDIAEQLDLPIGTVMSRLARAKMHLRRRLQPPAQPDRRGGPPHGL